MILVGKLVCCYNCIKILLVYGVCLEGLKIMVLLVSRVGIICLLGKWLGKLYGLNIVIMFSGWWCNISWLFVVLCMVLLVCLW